MLEDHRELMVSAVSESRRIRQLGFMRLPVDLQNEVIERLDRREISFRQASKICEENGHYMNREAIRAYYKALTIERRMYEMRCSMASAVRAI
jgi:hypothetical protein